MVIAADMQAGDVAPIGHRVRLGRWCHDLGLLPAITYARALLHPDLRILAYHRVVDVGNADNFEFDIELVSASAEHFRAQMQLLRRRFHPLGMAELLAMLDTGEKPPPNSVVVTFDDGYDDNCSVALPILMETGVQATFFVSTDHIDRGQPYTYDWLVHMICTTTQTRLAVPMLNVDCALPGSRSARRRLASEMLDRLKSLAVADQRDVVSQLEQAWQMPRAAGHPQCRPMSWAQVRELHAAGMEIGSHGVTHQMLAKLSDEELDFELRASKAAIEQQTGAPARTLSYPVGGQRAFDARVMDRATAAGYRLACSYISGTNPQRERDVYALRRLPVEREMGLAGFAALLALPEVFNYPTPIRST